MKAVKKTVFNTSSEDESDYEDYSISVRWKLTIDNHETGTLH